MPFRFWRLALVLGKPSFFAFMMVSLLIVALLAAVNIASRHGLKQYVEDQLSRIPWDITVYQSRDIYAMPSVAAALAATDGVATAEEVLFLRVTTTSHDVAFADDKPIRTPWLALLSTSQPSMLPTEIRPGSNGAALVLVGSKASMGNAYAALQNTTHFSILPRGAESTTDRIDEPHTHANDWLLAASGTFSVHLDRTLRVERNEINKWFLEQTSSPALMPDIGVILVAPHRPEIWTSFDALAHGAAHSDDEHEIHEEAATYLPDIIHLLRLNRDELISGWDIPGSLDSLRRVQEQLDVNTRTIGPILFIDNTTGILLERMAGTARLVGLLSLLVALPLLWMGWVLLANLSRLLLLNERRRFGLLRLRGAAGQEMGRALQLAIAAGALLGGLAGLVLGTVLPLLVYEGRLLPWTTLLTVQQPTLLALFLAIGLGVSLWVSRDLVRYAARISPLEAAGRVALSESEQARVRFGPGSLLALGLGGSKVVAWIAGWSLTALWDQPGVASLDRALDFVGFPLFVYGAVTLLASRRRWLLAALGLIVRLLGGPLREPILQHLATRPHRLASFLLIVALMTSISLYPTVMAAVFDNKIERGARVQLGSDLQLTLNVADLVRPDLLARGGIGDQYQAVAARMDQVLAALQALPGVASTSYMLEGVSEGLYVPGYGFNGLPLYFVPNVEAYLQTMYAEEALGQDAPFSHLLRQLPHGRVLLSPAVASYAATRPGAPVLLGRALDGSPVQAPVAGTIRYLPGSPLTSVTDKDSFAAARIDYVNHLFQNNAYVVLDPALPQFQHLDVLITSIHLAITLTPAADPARLGPQILATLPAEPLAARTLGQELQKVGTDMYVFLARQNVQIYLVGGLLLALVGILAIAYANYLDDRRTLGLLRIRGTGPRHMLQFFGAGVFAPSAIGLLLGAAVSLVVGYGMTNLLWELRAIRNILVYLATHLAVSPATAATAALLLALLLLVGWAFSSWAFRRSARHGLSES